MEVTEEMYTTLFNSINDVCKKLKSANEIIDDAVETLENAQLNTERMYITKDEHLTLHSK